MKTEGILVGIYQMPNQETPRLWRRAPLSVFISLEKRHLVWGSKPFYFIFYFPVVCLIVLANAVGLAYFAASRCIKMDYSYYTGA
jgi:hypothetical protein